jgi:hypothetical protein
LSTPIKAFVEDCCIVDPLQTVPIDDLYMRWMQWNFADGIVVEPKNLFSRDLHAAYPTIIVGQQRQGVKRVRVFKGIGLRSTSSQTKGIT